MFLEVFVDPMVLFCVLCILTPLVVVRDVLTWEDVGEYFTERSMCASLAIIPICWMIGKVLRSRQLASLKNRKDNSQYAQEVSRPLTYGERTRARWYLLNGLIIHVLMDGCIGVFKTNKLFADNYAKLDKRYGDPLGSFNGATVHVVSLMELFVKGPICVLLYWAYVTRHRSRDALEFFTCVTQAYGTVVYLGQEAVSGAPNLDVDYELTFSPHYILYFWFAIFFGCVLYLIVPILLGWYSFQRLCWQSGYAQRHGGARAASPKSATPSPSKHSESLDTQSKNKKKKI